MQNVYQTLSVVARARIVLSAERGDPGADRRKLARLTLHPRLPFHSTTALSLVCNHRKISSQDGQLG